MLINSKISLLLLLLPKPYINMAGIHVYRFIHNNIVKTKVGHIDRYTYRYTLQHTM